MLVGRGFIGGLGLDEWLGVGVPVLDPGLDVAFECGERVDAAADLVVGEEPNQRSTWFSHDELIGVKCRWNRGWAASQAASRGLWVDRLSQIRCTSSSAAGLIDLGQELLELSRRVVAGCWDDSRSPRPARRTDQSCRRGRSRRFGARECRASSAATARTG